MGRARNLASLISTENDKIKETSIDSDSISWAASSGGGTTAYASASLLPASAENGAQALTTDTNRLYIFSNSGWYNIALINALPYWVNQANASYVLSSTGEATVVQILAGDSDNINLTYTATGDSDFGLMATVSKDSDNGRKFTITPIDSEGATAVAATGTLTFRASDGINFVNTASSFSITFTSPYWRSAEFLLGADTSGGGISTFQDRGENTQTTSYTGTPEQRGGDIFGHWSLKMGGAMSYRTAHSTDFNISGDVSWTIEGWWRFDSTTGAQTLIQKYLGTDGWSLEKNASHELTFISNSGTISTGFTIVDNRWYHIAVARNAATDLTKVFVNGAEESSSTYQVGNDSTNSLYIGSTNGSTQSFSGKVHDVRIQVGSCQYTAAFTAPTELLQSTSDTKLLVIRNWNLLKDVSGDNRTMVLAGTNFSQKNDSPYGAVDGAIGNNSNGTSSDRGIGYVDYTERHMTPFTTIPSNNGVTLEMFIRWTGQDGSNTQVFDWGKHNLTGSLSMFSQSSGGDAISIYANNYSSNAGHLIPQYSMDNLEDRLWHHFVLARADDGTYRVWIDGASFANGTGWTGEISGDNNIYLCGWSFASSYASSCEFSGVRITAGDVYDVSNTSIAIPTSPVTRTSSAGTVRYYMSMDNLAIYDQTGKTQVTMQLNAAASSSITKYATSNFYHDGSNDTYLYLGKSTAEVFGTADFTLEFWHYAKNNTISSYGGITGSPLFDCRQQNNTDNGFEVRRTTATTLELWDSAMRIQATGITMLNTWVHIAVVKSAGTTTLYVDGVSQGTTTNIQTTNTLNNPIIGNGHRQNNGGVHVGTHESHYEDIHILQGVAKYTANFTPPGASISA